MFAWHLLKLFNVCYLSHLKVGNTLIVISFLGLSFLCSIVSKTDFWALYNLLSRLFAETILLPFAVDRFLFFHYDVKLVNLNSSISKNCFSFIVNGISTFPIYNLYVSLIKELSPYQHYIIKSSYHTAQNSTTTQQTQQTQQCAPCNF